jgi:hypothetical protein
MFDHMKIRYAAAVVFTAMGLSAANCSSVQGSTSENGDDTVRTGSTSQALTQSTLRDFNGDGLVDVLVHNAGSGESIAWLMNGTSIASSNPIVDPPHSLIEPGPPWIPAGVADMNGDGHVDMIWQNPQTGEVQTWFLTGTQRIGTASMHDQSSGALLSAPSPWYLGATGDFNGDGFTDLVFSRHDTGETHVWLMNGTNRTTDRLVFDSQGNIPEPSSDWSLVSAADFNQDGTPDLVWHSASSGEVVVWFMSGTNRSGWTTVTNHANGQVLSVDTHWSVFGTGDFNRDGYPDLLWYNASTGDIEIWYMLGTAYMSDGRVTPGLFDASSGGTNPVALPPWSPVAE